MSTVNYTLSPLIQDYYLTSIETRLAALSNFADGTVSDSSNISSYGTFKIPIMTDAVAVSEYIKGTTSLPLAGSAISHTKHSYETKLISTGLMYLDVVDENLVAADLVKGHIDNSVLAFAERLEQERCFSWSPVASNTIVAKTGANYTNSYGTTCKRITFEDIINIKGRFAKMGIKSGVRCILSVDDEMVLLGLLSNTNYAIGLTEDAVKRGAITMLYGIEFYSSNYTPAYTTGGVKKAFLSAGVTGDKTSTIFFHPKAVRSGVSPLEVKVETAMEYMSNYKVLVNQWMGASTARPIVSNDVTGVITLIDG